MIKSYILVFDNSVLPRQKVIEYLNHKSADINNWYAFMDNSIILLSHNDVHGLSELFRAGFPDVRHIITRAKRKEINGWIEMDAWDFINKTKEKII